MERSWAGKPGRSRPARLLGATALALTVLLGGLPVRVAAQPEEGTVSLRLVGQPVWHRPASDLGVKLAVTNETDSALEGFRISVGIDDRVTTRSDLHISFEAAPGFEATVVPLDFKVTVAPGATETVTLDDPVTSFSTLAGAAENGVYPTTYTLQDRDGLNNLDFIASPLVYYPQLPDTPLKLVLLLALNDPASREPDGRFALTADGVPLQRAAAAEGWLGGWLAALEEATEPPDEPRNRRRRRDRRPEMRPLSVALGPTPRMLEELADMSDGYTIEDGTEVAGDSPQARAAATALAGIRTLLGRDTVEPVLVPYSFPDMPTLLDRLGLEHALAQMSTATSVVRETTGVNLNDPWFFPPAGRIDIPTLEQLQTAGYGAKTFFSRTAIPFSDDPLDTSCPDTSPSFTCPISVETVNGVTRGFVADEGLAERLSLLQTEDEDRVYLQQFFAETSMIHEELPNVSGRVVQVTLPSLWHPTPRLARVLLRGIRSAPWIRTVMPDETLTSPRDERRELNPSIAALENTPDEAFFEDVAEADELVDSYGTMVPPTSERLRRLGRNTLVAESRVWWRSPESGADYATESFGEARSEMEKVTITGAEGTTFTSRSGEIQLLLSNNATYPVKVAIRFDSPGLEFEKDALIATYGPGNSPVIVEAETTSSGVFTLRVNLETIDGYVISSEEITIRSTSFNEIALGITIGALAFLVLFYVFRGIRKRREPEANPE
ncbi:MAG: DUF6049 family protein [Actinomycetota bacterium]